MRIGCKAILFFAFVSVLYNSSVLADLLTPTTCPKQKVGSHISIAQIKSNYKHCNNCGAMQDSDGQKVFYCTCCGEKSETPTCPSSQYIVNNQCKTCPANATCDGTNATCNSGYTKSARNGVVACSVAQNKCDSKQYVVGTTCTACPTNATCDGTNATCDSGKSWVSGEYQVAWKKRWILKLHGFNFKNR